MSSERRTCPFCFRPMRVKNGRIIEHNSIGGKPIQIMHCDGSGKKPAKEAGAK